VQPVFCLLRAIADGRAWWPSCSRRAQDRPLDGPPPHGRGVSTTPSFFFNANTTAELQQLQRSGTLAARRRARRRRRARHAPLPREDAGSRVWREVLSAGTMPNPAEALVRSHRFDLLMLDIALPGKNGIAWLRDLRAAAFAAEVVLITAFADLDTAIEALRAGASDFILKPFRVTQMLGAVRQALERARLRRENWVLRRAAPAAHAAGRRPGRAARSRSRGCRPRCAGWPRSTAPCC
jgi:CheY-like chemotaxis protein